MELNSIRASSCESTSDIQGLASAVLNEVSIIAVQLTQEKQQHQETRSNFEDIQTKVLNLEKEKQQLTSQIREIQQTHDQEIQEKFQELSESQDRIMKKEDEIQAVQEQLIESNQRHSELEDEVRQLNELIGTLETQLEHARDEKVSNQVEMNVLREDRAKIVTECDRWKATASSLEKNKRLLLEEREEFKKQTSQIQELKCLNQRLKQKLDEAERKIQDQTEEKTRTLEQKESNARESLEALKAEFKMEIQVIRASHTSELSQFHEQIQVIETDKKNLEDLKDELHHDIHEMKRKEKSLKDQLLEQRVESQNFQFQVKTLTQQVRELENSAKDSAKQHIEEQAVYSEKETQLQMLVDKLRDELRIVDTQHDQTTERSNQLAQQLSTVQKKCDALDKERQKYEQNYINQTSELKRLTAQLKEAETSKPEVNEGHSAAEIEALTRLVAKKDHEILLLQQTVHRECSERTSLLERMKALKLPKFNTPVIPMVEDSVPSTSRSEKEIAPEEKMYEHMRKTKRKDSSKRKGPR